MTDTIALVLGLVLTLFIYSYLVGDNPLYRIAVHILVGVSAAYAAVIAVDRILLPVSLQVAANPAAIENIFWLIPIVLAILLLLKAIRPLSWLGHTSVGFLVTVGAAVALVGAIMGTIIPQVTSPGSYGPLNLLLVTLLTIAVLLYFRFSGKRQNEADYEVDGPGTRSIRAVGQLVLLITFGAVFAGVFTTSLIILIERIAFLVTGLSSFFGIILP